MAEQHYDLYFRGEVLDGHFADFVKADIQNLFKAKPDYVEKLFSGQENLIKRQVDKATAIKFQQAFKKAGAKLIVRPHGAAPVSPSQPKAPVVAPAANPAADGTKATAARPAPAMPAEELTASLRPAGPDEGADDLIEHHQPDLQAPDHVPDWDVAAPGAQLSQAKPETNVDIDTSAFSVAETGADLLANKGFEEPAPLINTDDFSLAEPGADIETLDDKPAPVKVDTSHLSVK